LGRRKISTDVETMTTNPILADVLRGTLVESFHRGAFAIADARGIIQQAGDIVRPIFPRSAVKAFQCAPLIASGAADHFGLSDEEIALCCASHNGEPEHVRVARSILTKAGLTEDAYECGAHYPSFEKAKQDLVAAHLPMLQVHNNCSGKHAGMLAYATFMQWPVVGYTKLEHPVQQNIAKTMSEFCEVSVLDAPHGVDGCSVPTWALPLGKLAQGFAKLFQSSIGKRIANAVSENPFMVAGTKRFDTEIMEDLPRLFIKVGAEGVFCGAIPHAGLGFALKIDDGTIRAAEVAVARMLQKLNCWSDSERSVLEKFALSDMRNWRKIHVGETRSNF
jgi:L-asparaginase II